MVCSISHSSLLLLLIPLASSCRSLQISPPSCTNKDDYNCTFGKLENFHALAGQYSSFQDGQFSEKLNGNKIWSQLKWKAPSQEKVKGFLIILVNNTWEEYFFYNLTQDEFLQNNSETIFSFTCEKDFTSKFYMCYSGKQCFLADNNRKKPVITSTTTEINEDYTADNNRKKPVITSTTTEINENYIVADNNRKKPVITSTTTEINENYIVAQPANTVYLPSTNTVNFLKNKKASYDWLIIVGGVLLIILMFVLLVVLKCRVSRKKQNCDYDSVNKTPDQENRIKPNTSAEEPPEDDGISHYMAKINTNNKTSDAKQSEDENISYYLAKINAKDHDEKSIFDNSYQNLDL
ncbi:uncharacterized protein LOC115217258 isoform X1 [Octopus sinensis]|uniref:Uncharacterized protein LOC115217258 isoform X1 n=1 Tax=Octopus sinensis TaxID=2607531 RepID=A0A7E6F6W2_9MOLL|nr:uncharacterized protein LOC115217258 isoform X1 [Octopus sinensis]